VIYELIFELCGSNRKPRSKKYSGGKFSKTLGMILISESFNGGKNFHMMEKV